MIEQKRDFTFETVLSTDRSLLLLRNAKEQGYFVRCIYVLTFEYYDKEILQGSRIYILHHRIT